jgi:hypothetical protein
MRKVGLEVAVANSIKLPDRPISGPNEDLEAKEFPISLTVNIIISVKQFPCYEELAFERPFKLQVKEQI